MSRIIVYFSVASSINKEKKRAKSDKECLNNICAAPSFENAGTADSVSKDTDDLVHTIHTIFEKHYQDIQSELRQKQRKRKDKNDETTQNSEKPRAMPPLDAYQIKVDAPGCVFVDVTTFSWLSVLVTLESEFTGCDQWQRRHCHFQSSHGHQGHHCPLDSLAASKPEWWDRPLWAWNWRDMCMAQAAKIARTVLDSTYRGEVTWNATVSTDWYLSQLPSIHGRCSESCCMCRAVPILIGPDVDAQVIRRFVNNDEMASENPVLLKLRERYAHCHTTKTFVTNREYRDDLSSLLKYIKADKRRLNSQEVEKGQSDIASTRENGKGATVEIQLLNHSSEAVKVTPEAERLVKDLPNTLEDKAEFEVKVADDEYTPACGTIDVAEPRARTEPKQRVELSSSGLSKREEAPCSMEDSHADRSLNDAIEKSNKDSLRDQARKRYFEAIAKVPKCPQIDSSGVDITMLSQLPSSVRAEARIVFALNESRLKERKCKRAPAERSGEPQFDSSGIDLTLLSQMPASIRSEARIAAALSETVLASRRRKRRPLISGPLAMWLSQEKKRDGGNEAPVQNASNSARLSMSKIDMAILNELPRDIQATILSELSHESSTRSTKRKRSYGIDSFFGSAGKRFK
jgi:hypothetical protein